MADETAGSAPAAESAPRRPLVMWTVYDRPADYPHGYIARRFEVTAEGPRATAEAVAGPLDQLRAWLSEQGFVQLMRSEGDPPAIVETWI